MKPRLYLDIDGVLNSKKGDLIAKKKFPKESALLSESIVKNKKLLYKVLDSEAVSNLKTILDSVSPDVYIHSTWKHHFNLKDFKKFFDHWNLDSSLIKGVVPQYKMSSMRYHDLSWHIDGERISEKDTVPCTNYVVLDDYDMTSIFEDKDVFKTKQVVVDPATGLTASDAQKAIEILK